MKFSFKKAIVFGANGLVGNSIVRKFKNSNYIEEVISSKRNEVNLFNYKETKEFINNIQPDLVVNAAARVGGIFANNKYRSQFLIENLKININILESLIEFENCRIVNLGSSCIYPLDAENPITEDSIFTGKLEPTNSPYAIAKLAAIELADSMRIQYGHNILNLMPTNLYGPYDNFSEKDSHVIPGMMRRMHIANLNKEKIFKIWGSGTPKREFLHVDDLSDAVEFLITNEHEYDLLNVGSGEEVTILELANLLKKTIGYEGKIENDNSMPDGNPRKFIDSTKINNLGWYPKIKLEQGLMSTYKWFEVNNNKIRY